MPKCSRVPVSRQWLRRPYSVRSRTSATQRPNLADSVLGLIGQQRLGLPLGDNPERGGARQGGFGGGPPWPGQRGDGSAGDSWAREPRPGSKELAEHTEQVLVMVGRGDRGVSCGRGGQRLPT